MPSRLSEGGNGRSERLFDGGLHHQIGDRGFFNGWGDMQNSTAERSDQRRRTRLAIGTIAAAGVTRNRGIGLLGLAGLVLRCFTLILLRVMICVQAGMIRPFRSAGCRGCWRLRAMHHCRRCHICKGQCDADQQYREQADEVHGFAFYGRMPLFSMSDFKPHVYSQVVGRIHHFPSHLWECSCCFGTWN